MRPKVANRSVLGVRTDSASLNALGMSFGDSMGVKALEGSMDEIDAA